MRFFSVFFIILAFLFSPIFVFAKTPNDPYFAQWSYEHTGVYSAWDYTVGSKDIVVAIIDNGFDTFHHDLVDNLWKNKYEIENNGLDDDNNGYIDDIYGWNFLDNNNDPRPNVDNLNEAQKKEGIFNHGTIVAGIIGAKGNNNYAGTGLNWDVSLMNLKVIGNEGVGDFEPLVRAIYYAINNGADIINISMVGSGQELEIKKAIEYAYQKNVLVVAAAGNNMFDLNISSMYPVCSDEFLDKNAVFGVTAISKDHHLAVFSNVGSRCIDITAPGVDINSTIRFSPSNGLDDYYSINKSWSGTSFAAPFVSGAAALLKSMDKNLTVDEIIKTLITTVHHTPGQDEVVYANLFGAGLLQIDKAVKSLAKDVSIPNIISNDVINDFDLVLLDKKTGKTEFASNKENLDFNFANIEDTYIYYDNTSQLQNALLTTNLDKNKSIKIYNKNFNFTQEINLNLQGNFDLAIGKVFNNSNDLYLLLTPKFSSNIYLYVYDFSGNLVKKIEKDILHNGVSVDIYNQELVLTYILERNTILDIYKNLEFSNSFVIKNYIASQISVNDLENDSKNEYLLTPKEGTSSFVKIINNLGVESKSFRVFFSSYKKGFSTLVFDYNNDGNKDFIFTPYEETTPMKIIDKFGNLITEKFVFSNSQHSQIFTLFLAK
ncbi:MAG: S8 family peptidase [Candidatus Magasanikbacteria bacterium]